MRLEPSEAKMRFSPCPHRLFTLVRGERRGGRLDRLKRRLVLETLEDRSLLSTLHTDLVVVPRRPTLVAQADPAQADNSSRSRPSDLQLAPKQLRALDDSTRALLNNRDATPTELMSLLRQRV